MGDQQRTCRVCACDAIRHFTRVDDLDYLRCDECEATLLAEAHLPTLQQERARYEQHRNDPDDPAYREFVGQVIAPLLARIAPRSVGLDYGCGPGPALASMLVEAGHEMHLFDPIFAPDGDGGRARVLSRTYDFITCTETVEHFHDPRGEFQRLHALLRIGGRLAIMTNFQTDDGKFAQWHYRRDPTHVTFYRESTFRRIASEFGWQCEIPQRNIVMMRRET